MAELKGPLGRETCNGAEYSDFKTCVMKGVAADPNLEGIVDTEDVAFVHSGGGDRQLGWCTGCPGQAPRGTFCFSVCCARRRLEEDTGTTPNLRRVQESDTAVFEGGAYTGNTEGISILKTMTTCLDESKADYPCLGTIDTMTVTVTL
jgi:hypothetical protein